MTSQRTGRQVQGERRVITMVFCDVTGSTAMAEQLDPEEWAEIMNEAFEYMVAPIYRYEGTVARMMGDGFLAFFGAPVSHEDDPQRAIYAGLDILGDIAPFRSEIQEDYGLDFDIRIGINTGPVVVGEMGTQTTLEYTAMGDAINVAARMEATATPGSLQISADTYELVAPLFEVEALGEMDIKGKDEPIAVYRVLSRKERPGRLRGIEGLDAPLIGREQEFESLVAILNQVHNGRGGIVALIGEAGLGKSRLIDELRNEWRKNDDSDLSWSESHGVPYESTRPYSLFRKLQQNSLGLSIDDPAGVVREKIAIGMEGLPANEKASFRRAIETMLAVEETRGPKIDAEALKRELYDAIYRAWYDACQNRPSVIVFDDFHWADPASIDLVLELANMIREVPLLIICGLRPDRDSAGWRLMKEAAENYPDYYAEIELAPLDDKESRELVDNLLTIAELPEELHRLILRKAEGNPFFVEEMIRTLIDIGAIQKDESGMRWQALANVDDIDVPDNLQALLISRIDRLDKEAKQTLQLASVIGRSFYHRILDQIADKIQDLSRELDILEQVDLIRESARDPELEYIFRHELTRDATYRTLLRRQRRRYHRRVGEAIESIFSERLTDEAHRLAYHFHQAGDSDRTLKYYTMAGDRAARLYANTEAIDYYNEALGFAGDKASNEQLIHIYIRRGRAYEVCGQYDEAMDNYQDLRKIAQELANSEMELEALVAQATLRSTYTDKFDPEKAAALSKLALEMARDQDNPRAEAKIYWNMMLANTFAGTGFEDAANFGERSLAIARKHDLREQLAYTLHDLARPYAITDRFQEGLSSLLEAGEIFEELGNLPMLADNRTTLASAYFFSGRLDKGLAMAEKALEISKQASSLWGQAYATSISAPLLFSLGRVDEALTNWQNAITMAERANFVGSQLYARHNMALAYSFLGDPERGVALIEEENRLAMGMVHPINNHGATIILANIHATNGDLDAANFALAQLRGKTDLDVGGPQDDTLFILAEGKTAMIRSEYEQAATISLQRIEELKQNDWLLYLAFLADVRGQALLKMNRSREAISILEEGRDAAQRSGSRFELIKVLSTLAKVELERGNLAKAEQAFKQGQQATSFVAGHISDEDLRRRFLNLHEVRLLMENGSDLPGLDY